MAVEEEDQDTPDAQRDGGGSAPGGISIGVMTGGAAAAGHRASAEDRSRRAATTPPPYAGAAPPTGGPGGIGIGVMTGGAAAAGEGARAVDASAPLLDAPPELALAVRTLREHLGMLGRTPEIAELDAGLSELDEAMAGTGQVRRDRLQWLRDRLTLGATTAAGLASAAAVVETIVQLTG